MKKIIEDKETYRFSIEEKLVLYNEVLYLLQNNQCQFICITLYHVINRYYDMDYHDYSDFVENIDVFPEFWKHKPVDKNLNDAWFDTDKNGYKSRLKIVNDIIEELKTMKS